MWIWMIRKVLHHPLFKFFPYVRHMGSCRESISRRRPEILRKLLTKAKSILGTGGSRMKTQNEPQVYTPWRFPLMSEKHLGFKGLLCCLLSFMSARTEKTKGSKKQFGFCLSLNHELWCVCMVVWSEMATLVWSCCLWHRPWKGAVKKE